MSDTMTESELSTDVLAAADKLASGVGAKPKYTQDGMRADLDAEMDAAIENIPSHLKEQADLPKSKPKKEQPKAAESERSEDAPTDDEAEADAEADKGTKAEAEPNYALEKALAALRLDGVPSETLDAMLANQAGRNQILTWGSKVSEKHAATAEKLKNQAEELKRAQAPKDETTSKAEASSPTVDADFSESLEAFREYGEEFQKGQGQLARAVHKAARDSVMAEFQPVAAVLLEMRSVLEEMVTETLDRETKERFPGLVEGKAKEEAEAAFKRLWGKSGESYKDAAPTFLGRVRAARADAYKLVDSKQPAPRKDDSQRKAQHIPASPARTTPRKALSLDEEVDSTLDTVLKRWDKS